MSYQCPFVLSAELCQMPICCIYGFTKRTPSTYKLRDSDFVRSAGDCYQDATMLRPYQKESAIWYEMIRKVRPGAITMLTIFCRSLCSCLHRRSHQTFLNWSTIRRACNQPCKNIIPLSKCEQRLIIGHSQHTIYMIQAYYSSNMSTTEHRKRWANGRWVFGLTAKSPDGQERNSLTENMLLLAVCIRWSRAETTWSRPWPHTLTWWNCSSSNTSKSSYPNSAEIFLNKGLPQSPTTWLLWGR